MSDKLKGLYKNFIVPRTDGQSAPGQKHDRGYNKGCLPDKPGGAVMSEHLICPLRPSGDPCVEVKCAWYDNDECSILSMAKSLYTLSTQDAQKEASDDGKGFTTIGGIPWSIPEKNKIIEDDDDVPF